MIHTGHGVDGIGRGQDGAGIAVYVFLSVDNGFLLHVVGAEIQFVLRMGVGKLHFTET